MLNRLRQLPSDDRGATAIEYGLIVGLVFLTIIGGIGQFATAVIGVWTTVSGAVTAAVG